MLSKNPDLANQTTVSIVDLATIAASFGSMPNSRSWNSNADLNGDRDVSIADLAIATSDYGATVLQE